MNAGPGYAEAAIRCCLAPVSGVQPVRVADLVGPGEEERLVAMPDSHPPTSLTYRSGRIPAALPRRLAAVS